MPMTRNGDKTPDNEPPLIFRWDEGQPLPRKLVRPSRPLSKLSPVLAAPDWVRTGPRDQPFDFCGHLRALIADVVRRCPELAHIQPERLLIGVTQARGDKPHGLQARITPLRFPRGNLTRLRRKVLYQVQRYFLGEREFLYLMTFCLPRFLEQDFDGKLVTLFHELFHIGPRCDGDLRRHEGRYEIHTRSQRDYDRFMAQLAREYLATRPEPSLHEFLRLSFAQLHQRHGGVSGLFFPRPKVVPLLGAAKKQNAPSQPDARA